MDRCRDDLGKFSVLFFLFFFVSSCSRSRSSPFVLWFSLRGVFSLFFWFFGLVCMDFFIFYGIRRVVAERGSGFCLHPLLWNYGVVGLEFCLGMFSSAFLGIHRVVAEQGSCFFVEETRIWILPTSMMVELPCAAGAGIVSFRFLLAHSLPNLVQKWFLFFSFSLCLSFAE